jgi:hypothetical protein
MKALSIQQPWAWAILYAGKDVENRNWPTKFRGQFAVHAPLGFDDEGFTFLRVRLGATAPIKGDFPRGGIVGTAVVADCIESSASPWFFGRYGFVLREPTPLQLPGGRRIIECKGARGHFFDLPQIVLQAMS